MTEVDDTTIWADLEKNKDIWSQIDLKTKKNVLDKQGLDIAEQREKSASNRKNLAAITKNFKKLPDSEKSSSYNSVLKSYQEEIDNLSKRSLSAETAFLEFYNAVRDAPDPSLIMSTILIERKKLTKSHELEAENEKLKIRISEYEQEFKGLKNQDVTIRQLEEKNVELERMFQEQIQKQLNQKQQELNSIHDEAHRSLKESAALLRTENDKLKREVEQLRQVHESAQNDLFLAKSKSEENEAKAQVQLDILNDDNFKLTNQITHLENEIQIMREKLDASFDDTNNNDSRHSHFDDELEVSQREAVTRQMIQKVDELNQELQVKKSKIETLTLQHSQAVNRTLELEKSISLLPTVESYKSLESRLDTMEQIQFGALTRNNENVKIRELSVEQLLHDKNRLQEDQLTKLRLSLSDAQQESKTFKSTCDMLSKQLNEAVNLNKKVEQDLLVAQQPPQTPLTAHTPAPTPSSLVAAVQDQPSTNTDAEAMLQIVSQQRNRFRESLNKAEEEKQNLDQQLTNMKHENAKLHDDNVKLYEKIRYLQSYGHGNKETSVVVEKAADGSIKQRNITFQEDETVKYKKLYEEKLDPFSQFHREERNEQFKKLSAAERITFRASRIMLSHKYSRIFLFFYMIALHLLVFATVYRLSSIAFKRR
ncbi:chromosome segregation protein SMC [Acrasis kona]|uniref:Protein CASP n=1 Tax=Acrasis kona TaxID=1008807 RepID=A0AAW2ZNW4_9EUKA